MSDVFNFRRKQAPNVTAQDLHHGLAELGLTGREHVLVHASLRSFGQLEGGAATLLDSLLKSTATLAAPAFTYGTLMYNQHNPIHATFHRDRRVSREIGALPQAMVERPDAARSFHPVLSFVAMGTEAKRITSAQTLKQPYQPVGELYELGGYSLMIGTGFDSNTSIHYGEYLAGLPYLTRYAPLNGQVQPIAFPSCSADFDNIAPHLAGLGKNVRVGNSTLRLLPIRGLVDTVISLLETDPTALLCRTRSCRCQQVRRLVERDGLMPRQHVSMTKAEASAEAKQRVS